MYPDSSLAYNAHNEARERDVRGLLHVMDEFGSAAERFFDRLYRGLNRKERRAQHQREPDQLAALRQANRELTARVRSAQTVAARLQAVFASIGEGVVMQDTEGRIVLM